jgi:hypothetical protein
MSAREVRVKPDFSERVKASHVPVGRLIGFEAKDIADGLRGRVGSRTTARQSHGDIARRDSLRHCRRRHGMAFASTLTPEECLTTVELKINFFRPIWQAVLKAEGIVVQRDRTIGYVECNITDEENRLVARAASTCMVLRGRKALGR